MNMYLKLLLYFFIGFIIIGCAASSHIVVGQTRPAISPTEVKLYSKSPEKYDEIAVIDASSKNSWAVTDQGKVDIAIERLKEEAASLGANGILIQLTGDISTGSVSTGYGSSGYGYGISSSALHKTAKGLAIHVYE